MKLQSTKVKRNAECPCGSGRKAKKCCLRKIQIFQDRLSAGEDSTAIIVSTILAGAPPEPETQPDPKGLLSPE